MAVADVPLKSITTGITSPGASFAQNRAASRFKTTEKLLTVPNRGQAATFQLNAYPCSILRYDFPEHLFLGDAGLGSDVFPDNPAILCRMASGNLL